MSSILPGSLSKFICTPEGEAFEDISLVDKEGDVHPVSKIIMAAHSKVLHNIFTHEDDQSKTIFLLPTVPGIALDLILDWIKTGELALRWSTAVLYALETAEFLEIQLVSSLCQDWVEVRMNSHNVLGVWRFAKDYFLQSLEKSSWKFATARFT